MRFSHLETYLEIVRCGSFSEAAKSIGVSQSAISQQITALEGEVSSSLLVRGVPGVLSLTPAGEILLIHAKSIIKEYQTMRSEINSIQTSVKGTLCLAASAIPGNYLLPEIILEFQDLYPEVDVRLNVANSSDVIQKLLMHECEIGFVGAPIRAENYETEIWVNDELGLAVHPEHPYAKLNSIQLKDLENQALILREEGSGTRETIESSLDQHGWPLSKLKVVLVLGSTHGVVNAIRMGLGIGFVSTFASSIEDLPFVKIDGLNLTREILIAYDTAHTNTYLHKTFLEFTRNRVEKYLDKRRKLIK